MNGKMNKLLILLMSESSDDDLNDSSDEDETEKMLLHFAFECFVANKRLITRTFAEKRIENYTPQQFEMQLGINKILALSLSSKFEQTMQYRSRIESGQKSLSARSNLFIFLWFITHQNVSYRHVAKYFGISLSTVHFTLFRVAKFLSELSCEVIKWPGELERTNTSDFYLRRTGISGIVGAIGNHLIKTENSKYVDLNNTPIQAVCNEQNKFIDLFIGDVSHVVENTLFENSNIVEKLYILNDDEHIVGNLDFPCLQNLITPVNFSEDINFCLQQIEQCFNKLTDKFRHLNCLKVKNSKLKVLLIKSCFVLYNLDCCNSEISTDFEDNYATNEHNYSIK